MSDRLGLTRSEGGQRANRARPITELVIRDPSHPLAAGLTGTIPLSSWPGQPKSALRSPTGRIVASYPGAAADVGLIFAYERGSKLARSHAPARRVGLLLQPALDTLTLSDQGWRLFDAAVSWCAHSRGVRTAE